MALSLLLLLMLAQASHSDCDAGDLQCCNHRGLRSRCAPAAVTAAGAESSCMGVESLRSALVHA